MFLRSAARTLLESSLLDAASIFGDAGAGRNAHLDRHLNAAVTDFDRVAPLLEGAQIQLVADAANYAADARAVRFHGSEVLDKQTQLDPWDEYRVPEVPTPSLARISNTKTWVFRPVPTAFILDRIGTIYPFTYFAAHVLHDTDAAQTTFDARHLPLLVLRAQVEALRDLAVRNAHKPVALRDPNYSQIKNGTPAALAEQFMRLWESQIRPVAEIYGTVPVFGARR
jgi:hypothetical protein